MQNPAVAYLRKAIAAHDRVIAILKKNLCGFGEPQYYLRDTTFIGCSLYRKLGRGDDHIGLVWDLNVTVDQPGFWIQIGIYTLHTEKDGMTITEPVLAFDLSHMDFHSALNDLWWGRIEDDTEHRHPQLEEFISKAVELAGAPRTPPYAFIDEDAIAIIEGMIELYKTYRAKPMRQRKPKKAPATTAAHRRKRSREAR